MTVYAKTNNIMSAKSFFPFLLILLRFRAIDAFLRAILKRKSVKRAIFATYTAPRNVSLYSSASHSCKNVEVLLPHARGGCRGSEI